MLREYIVSEAMAALGIPTTRSLAAVTTGEPVMRETVLPGAVLTRVASSHIRVGTFQFFAARGDVEALRLLADHVIARHYPGRRGEAEPYRALLDGVIARQAELVAQWMLVGFIHGVMNTDNCSIAGETIDYGPCAFMDAYDPETVFSSIDHGGRYAYGNQPRIAHWNLARLGETLLPLLADDNDKALAIANESLGAFQARYAQALIGGHAAQARPVQRGATATRALAQDLLNAMADGQADFTLTFRRLDPEPDAGVAAAVRESRRLRRLGRALARAAGARAAGRRDPTRGDAVGQSRLHPAQSPRRGGPRRGDRTRRLRAVRGIAEGAVAALRGPRRIRRLRRAAAGRAARLPDVLRHLRQAHARQVVDT